MSALGQAWALLGTGARVCVALGAAGSIFTAAWAWPAAKAAMSGGVPNVDLAASLEQRASQYAEAVTGWVKQTDGRTMFFVPAAPPPPPPPPPPEKEEGPPPPPPPPATYGGPAIVAIVNDTVWFADGTKRGATSEGESGVKVISISPPWEARVLWEGVEFNVPVFARDAVVMPATPEPTPKPESSPGGSEDDEKSNEDSKVEAEQDNNQPAPQAEPEPKR